MDLEYIDVTVVKMKLNINKWDVYHMIHPAVL